VSGNHITTQPKTITGNARRTWHYITPKGRKGGSAGIVFDLRHGARDAFVPLTAAFSCKGSTLVLTEHSSTVVPKVTYYSTYTFTYRRV
jgi:hypothetical protein